MARRSRDEPLSTKAKRIADFDLFTAILIPEGLPYIVIVAAKPGNDEIVTRARILPALFSEM